jgi:hypothetical protein
MDSALQGRYIEAGASDYEIPQLAMSRWRYRTLTSSAAPSPGDLATVNAVA